MEIKVAMFVHVYSNLDFYRRQKLTFLLYKLKVAGVI